MAKASKFRLGVLVLVAGLMSSAMLLSAQQDNDDGVVEASPVAVRANRQVTNPDDAKVGKQNEHFAVADQPEDNAPVVDPFAPRNWQPAPVPPPAPVAPAVVEQAAPPPAPTAPPLPYKYMGRFVDGGEVVVYLAKGDETVLAHANDTLQSTYKILAIKADAVEMEYLPTGERQAVPIPSSQN